MATVDLAKLRELEAQGYLTGRNHPAHPLLIWNYTPKAQFDRYWTPETMMCRGLITDLAGTIVKRPFIKFFSPEQWTDLGGVIPNEPFEVTDKWDGSLGIHLNIGDEPYFATRGSFTSEQAIKGTEILRRKYANFPWHLYREYTLLFEIVYPANRIVCSYGNMEDIVLLAMIHNETGAECNIHAFHQADPFPFPVAKRYDGIKDIQQIKQLGQENQEGFVVRFTESNLRLKIKLAEYVRLHKILTGIHARHIWEYLSQGKSLDELLDRVPDEFFNWVKQTDAQLRLQFNEIEQEAMFWTIRALRWKTRKEQAELVKRAPYPQIIFKMLDGKPYDEAIWKLIKPAVDRPFRQDEAA